MICWVPLFLETPIYGEVWSFTVKHVKFTKKNLVNWTPMGHSIIQNKKQKHESHKKLKAAAPEAIAFVPGHIEKLQFLINHTLFGLLGGSHSNLRGLFLLDRLTNCRRVMGENAKIRNPWNVSYKNIWALAPSSQWRKPKYDHPAGGFFDFGKCFHLEATGIPQICDKSTRAKRKSLTSGLTFGYIRILASCIWHCDHCHCQQPWLPGKEVIGLHHEIPTRFAKLELTSLQNLDFLVHVYYVR